VNKPLWEYAVSPDLTKAIVQDADPLEAFLNRGFAHLRKAQWDMAIASYNKAITAAPDLERDNYNRPWAEGKRKEWDLVIADYTKMLEMNNLFKSMAINSGQNEWDMAIADYKKVIEVSRSAALIQKAKDTLTAIDTWRVMK
jgi:tetratricopeptide (TPR) repeat protein